MSIEVNESINNCFLQSNRVVITGVKPFNPKNKKQNEVLSDIRDHNQLELLRVYLHVNLESCSGNWLSPVDFYFNFMKDKSYICNIGFLLRGWLRSEEWHGDFELESTEELSKWLLKNGISSCL